MKTTIVINHDGMGHGDPELGKKILGTFFVKSSGAFPGLETIVFYNSGVRCLVDADLIPVRVVEGITVEHVQHRIAVDVEIVARR